MALEIEGNYQCVMTSSARHFALNSPKIYIVDGIVLVQERQLKKFSTYGRGLLTFAEAFKKESSCYSHNIM